jgi:enterochelin esterase-like enzyme
MAFGLTSTVLSTLIVAGSLTEHQYRDRVVRVLVPEGYDEKRPDAYPLLLLHDGQNLFEDGSTAPGGGSWHVDRTIEPLMAAGRIPPMVVAGIDHAGDERIREFAPTPAGKLGRGGASEYARLVVADLLPRISADYHVRTDPDGIGLGGSSMGGLVTLWMAILFPGFFGRLIVMSPSLWWDRRVVLRHLRRHELDPLPRIWLDAGRREGSAVTRDTRELHKLLRRPSSTAIRYVEDPRGDHSETSWARRFPEAIEFLYGA